MDLQIDTLIVIDPWWNMPTIVAKNIHAINCDEMFVNCTMRDKIHESFAEVPELNDLHKFIAMCKEFKEQQGRPKNVLLCGQAWDCGIHWEALGVDNLIKFIGLINLYVDPKCMAMATEWLDRTCTENHVMEHKYSWKKVNDQYFECQKLGNTNE